MNALNISKACSICGRTGRLRRGWCAMHYQRWCRTGDPNVVKRRSADTFRCKIMFTLNLWNRWLAQLNMEADSEAVTGINSLRVSIEERERSAWGQHHGVPRR